jgi:hypothetical protein
MAISRIEIRRAPDADSYEVWLTPEACVAGFTLEVEASAFIIQWLAVLLGDMREHELRKQLAGAALLSVGERKKA